jgi:hypothetical protein
MACRPWEEGAPSPRIMRAWRRAPGLPWGEVVEWLMAPVLKTGDPQGSVGSNPTLSVEQVSQA